MKLFGTDGVRGLVNMELDSTFSLKLGASVAHILKKDLNKDKLTFLIGGDTRISYDMLKSSVVAGFLSEGCDIIDTGIIPTPAISYLIIKYDLDGGFVISASHNPVEYNGIKVFNNKGYKLNDEIEKEIEDYLLNDFKINKNINEVGKVITKDLKLDYINFLLGTIDCHKIPFKVIIDVANGASYKTADMLFSRLDIDYKIIHNEVDGYNINNNSGSTHIEVLQKMVIDSKYDLGIAFDGDADRCLFVDDKGEIVDGDYILAIASKYLKLDSVVGTIMSNLGLIKYLKENNIKFISTNVGDKYVLEEMLKNNELVGGEQSGHIIFKKYLSTGDGELTALQILNIMTHEDKLLSELKTIMIKYPQVLVNLEVTKEIKDNFDSNLKVQKLINEYRDKINENGRILVRKSGTENLIRIMIEGEDLEFIKTLADSLKREIEVLIK